MTTEGRAHKRLKIISLKGLTFQRSFEKNGWMDLSELRDIDCLHNEGTNTVVMGESG